MFEHWPGKEVLDPQRIVFFTVCPYAVFDFGVNLSLHVTLSRDNLAHQDVCERIFLNINYI
jgi:hypothetical protein